MALIAFAGFEDGSLLEISPIGSAAVVTTSPRTGTYCLYIPKAYDNQFYNGWRMPVNSGEFYFQWAIKKAADAASSYTDRKIFAWLDAGSVILGCFTYNIVTNAYDVWIGDKATFVGSVQSPISTNWGVFEGYIKISDDVQVGKIIIRVNGVVEVDFTGDTKINASTIVTSIKHGSIMSSGSSPHIWMDDIIVNDTTGTSFNSWPMGIKCHKVTAPTANGYYHAWTPSAGQNFECIDETPPTMDDFLEASVGNKDSYEFGDAPVGLTGIAGVVVRYYGQGDGNIKRLCRYGSVDYLSEIFALPGTFNQVIDIMTEKPGGGSWNETIFNACEFGMEQQ